MLTDPVEALNGPPSGPDDTQWRCFHLLEDVITWENRSKTGPLVEGSVVNHMTNQLDPNLSPGWTFLIQLYCSTFGGQDEAIPW